ncbi:ABC transporter ATP-binding protein [Corynebacterium bovis]|uniref:ABC transporter ATP-binding protein n=1 Tax=Corynebacterium bovis TaxID=36808 RepID=UPI000F6502C1|nr:ATP-binding cassette domain-containing protein [Corynebacterium bovis]RRO95092.1 hypothetical protein CXF29_05710 [Corynebacterium bovis]RRQ15342.1 hypothetical protein CXF46_08965 [Corynebacterium bovis]
MSGRSPGAAPASGAGPSAPFVLLDGVSFDFPGTRFRDLTLEVGPGELILLDGPNGAGKTTVLTTIAGFRTPSRGRRGPTLPRVGTRRHQTEIGYLPSDPGPLVNLPLRKWTKLMASSFGVRDGELRDMWVAMSGDPSAWDTSLSDLSTGNRKRTLLLLAFELPRRLLLLDEPFESVDDAGSDAVAGVIRDQLSRGAAAVVVSQRALPGDLRADRTVVLGDRDRGGSQAPSADGSRDGTQHAGPDSGRSA